MALGGFRRLVKLDRNGGLLDHQPTYKVELLSQGYVEKYIENGVDLNLPLTEDGPLCIASGDSIIHVDNHLQKLETYLYSERSKPTEIDILKDRISALENQLALIKAR